MTDRIIMENMLFFGYHGVLPAETSLGQRFAVSLTVECPRRHYTLPDEPGAVLDYSRVYLAVKEIMEGGPCRLLETLAEKIAAQVLALGASVVRVTVKKLHPPLPGGLDFVAVEIMRDKHSVVEAYLGLGSNLGDRCGTLDAAVRQLGDQPGISVVRVAAYRETAPAGYLEQGNFINTAVAVNTTLSPLELLETIQRIEADFGRKREIRFGPRTLDIDLLLYGDRVVDSELLVIPHPRLYEREFVLVPLAEIAPEARIPPGGLTAREMLTRFYTQRRL